MTNLGNVFGTLGSQILGGIGQTTAFTAQSNLYYQSAMVYGSNPLMQTQITNIQSPWIPQTTAPLWQQGLMPNAATAQTINWAYQNYWQFMTVGGTAINTPNVWCPKLTPEEIAARDAEVERMRIRREDAGKRAKVLLGSVLNKDQQGDLDKSGYFDVEVSGRKYRITPGAKVIALDHKGKAMHRLCIHPEFRHDLPVEDIAIAQKLMLETRESEFLRIANKWAA